MRRLLLLALACLPLQTCVGLSLPSWLRVSNYPHSVLHPCPLRAEPGRHLEALFRDRFRSQDVALRTLLEAVQAWSNELGELVCMLAPWCLGWHGPAC